ncbi:MAG: hypothetical protein ACXVRS_00045 [Gaiellaceae bacterium]
MSASATDLHRLEVGGRTHQIVAETLRDNGNSRATSPLTVTQAARRVLAAHPISYRPRESFLEAVTAAGVYLQRLRPPDGWELIVSEHLVRGCRFDLVWEHEQHGVLVDELKLGVGRGGELAVRAQIDRYLSEGARTWTKFVGVRLCAVHEPGTSRLFLPGRRRSSLVSESELAQELAPR